MTGVAIEQAGRRWYVVGQTYSLRDQLRAAGAHWDTERKQWWVGAAKRAEVEALVAKCDGAAPSSNLTADDSQRSGDKTPDPGSRVKSRVTYKGKDYYVLAGTERDGIARLLLAARNGQFQFWAQATSCQVVRHYGREDNRTGRTEYPTLQSLMAFATQAREARAGGECARCAFRERQGIARPYCGSGDYEECPMCGATYEVLR